MEHGRTEGQPEIAFADAEMRQRDPGPKVPSPALHTDRPPTGDRPAEWKVSNSRRQIWLLYGFA